MVYALKCAKYDLFYIGKTFNKFKERFRTHKSVIRKAIERKISTGSFVTAESDKDCHYLIKHFCENHGDCDSLQWLIIHQVGKVGRNPAVNLLQWERAYIEGFGTICPKGLNSI